MAKSNRRRNGNDKVYTMAEKLSDGLELPIESLPGTSHIELCGNKQAIVGGCKGILEYDENIIRFNTGRLIVRVIGSDLCIRAYQDEEAVICGNIISVDFSS